MHSSQALNYGKKSRQLLASPQSSRTELYRSSSNNGKDGLQYTGSLTHKLEMKRAQEIADGIDPALAELQSKMLDHEKKKQSNTYVTTITLGALTDESC